MRTICDSLFLFDHQTRVSPKLDEFAETGSGCHRARTTRLVVFSQWETMILEGREGPRPARRRLCRAARRAAGQGPQGGAGAVRNDPACKVFLSTDAGGTGSNLQMADTVVNLELPWNPAVLEQRIARVHRMGQSRPVRVVNFVTRGTIEERVLRTLATKQGLFTGLFAGDADEIPFEAARASGFLDSMRALVNEGVEARPLAERVSEPGQPPASVVSVPAERGTTSPNLMWQGVAQLLEAACATLANPAELMRITPEMRAKLRETASEIAHRLQANSGQE